MIILLVKGILKVIDYVERSYYAQIHLHIQPMDRPHHPHHPGQFLLIFEYVFYSLCRFVFFLVVHAIDEEI